ncbi:MAG TPA: ABC transporter ATP-binding protein [Verrucomicrobiales bacterium]|nr:ABC transporter [Roseibacillus sp.]HBM76708.1 ABC transporter ATP-binding protein [Verrucomicrobiales bacterium]
MLKRLRPYTRYLRPVRWQFIGALIAGLIYGVASGAGIPLILKEVLPRIWVEGPDPVPFGDLIMVGVIMVGGMGIRCASEFANMYGMAYCGQRVLEGLRTDTFAHLQKLSLSFFERRRSGDTVSRLITDTEVLRAGIVTVTNDIIKQPFTLMGAAGVIIYLSLQNSQFVFILAFLISAPACVFPIRWLAGKLKIRAKKLQAQVGDVSAYVTDSIQAPREIRAFNLQEGQVSGMRRRVRELMKWQLKVLKYERSVAPLVEFVATISIAVVIVYAGRNSVGIQQMVPLLGALYFCYEPVKKLGKITTHLKSMEASLDRLEEISKEEPEVLDPKVPVDLHNVEGEIAFNEVSFAYAEDLVLKRVTVKAGQGEVIGIVGPSGAGKTSFINLLLRFYDPTEGVVSIDGHDLRTLRQEDLRDAIAFVPQEPLLFNASVRDNILVGRPDATDEEIYKAAGQARAHDFITAMENGYETFIGEKGTRLSGGQRQRLALARAFLRKAPILVLDEAASALDSENEALVQQAVVELAQDRTVFIIAHRFSTLSVVDRILVFEDGEIVGDGTNEELEKSCQLYQELRQRQKVE